VEVGSEVTCCMLDVDWSEFCIVVSLNPKLVEGYECAEKEGRKKSRRGKKGRQTMVC